MELIRALINCGEAENVTEAKEIIAEMRHLMYTDGANPEELLYELGLEPDYVFDLLSGKSKANKDKDGAFFLLRPFFMPTFAGKTAIL